MSDEKTTRLSVVRDPGFNFGVIWDGRARFWYTTLAEAQRKRDEVTLSGVHATIVEALNPEIGLCGWGRECA